MVGYRRVPYVVNPDLYRDYYRGSGLPVFKGSYQDGSGLLSSIARFALPLLKGFAKSAGKTFLRSGAQALSDVVSGEKDIKTALRQRGLESLKQIGKNTSGQILNAIDGKQTGGRRRKRKRTTRNTRNIRDSDIFDEELVSRVAGKKTCVRRS